MKMKTMGESISDNAMVNSPHPDSDNTLSNERTSGWEILAALLPFLIWGAAWIYAAIRDIFPAMSSSTPSYQWYLVAHAVTLVGLGVGWWLKFPRWSYLYAGLVVTYSSYWAGLAMNGWRILGFNFLEDDRWSWRAWIPFLTLVLIMLLLTHSVNPVKKFFTGIWKDWSRLSLALYGWLAFLLITINLDSIEMQNEFWQPILMVMAFLGGVAWHMSVNRPWKRALGLDLGIFIGVGGSILLGRILYPDVSRYPRLSDISPRGFALYILFMIVWVLVWLGLVFLPAVLTIFHKTKEVASAT